MTSAPFNAETDEALGIAYVAIFILVSLSRDQLVGLGAKADRTLFLDQLHFS